MLSNEERGTSWRKVIALLVVVGVVVGTVSVFPKKQRVGEHVNMKMAMKRVANEDGTTSNLAAVDWDSYRKFVEHAPEEERVTDETEMAMVAADLAGKGNALRWVNGMHPKNCPQICRGKNMIAVSAGAKDTRPQYNSRYFVCAARGRVPYHGLRPGFNLPNWNDGKCAFSWGGYDNRGIFKCLCRKRVVKPRWVHNKKLIASCGHVCQLKGKRVVRGGTFKNMKGYPRYDICAVCHPVYGCRGGWNLDLVGWASYCSTPWGSSHTKATDFKCLCV